MSNIYATATEYRYLPLTVDPIDGEPVTLNEANVQVSVTGPGQDGEWRAIDRLVVSGGVFYAGVLFGPGHIELAVGTYALRARVTDAPETVEPWPARHLWVVAPPS